LAAYYGAGQMMDRANSIDARATANLNNTAGLQLDTRGNLSVKATPVYTGTSGLKVDPNAGAKNLMDAKYNRPIVVNVYGAADSRESARAIERTLKKLNLNGGSGAGVLGFN